MNPVPQLFKPLIELYANTDSFTERAIETTGMEKLRKADRYTARTSEIAKLLGQADVLSPVQIDHLIRGYFGWLGTAAVTTTNQIARLGSANEQPAMNLHDAFLVGNFVETLPANGSRYVTQMYEQSRAIEEAYTSWRHYLKIGDTEQAASLLADRRDDIVRYHQVQKVKRAESALNARARRVEADRTKTGRQKRDELDRIAAQKDRFARSVAGFPGG
jgi:hypothetical protein